MAEGVFFFLVIIIVGIVIGVAFLRLPRLFESTDQKIERLKQNARDRQITKAAIQIARLLGKREHIETCAVIKPDFQNFPKSARPETKDNYYKIMYDACDRYCRDYRYEDSVFVIAVLSQTKPTGVVIRHKASEKKAVFAATFSETDIYEYSSGKYLEPREGGGYDVKEEYAVGGGFSEDILSYIPGDWEAQLRELHKEARAKADLEQKRQKQEVVQSKKKRFGL